MSFRPCLVVPVYEHGDGAAALADKLVTFGMPTIVVNDGSAAATTAILRRLAERHDWIQLLAHETNQGKGAAVLTGLRAAHARGFSHALQIDADGQHDAADIPRFLALAAANPSAVVTGRPLYDSTAPTVRRIARYLTHVWVWIETLSLTIRDSMCGFRVYPLEPAIKLTNQVRLGRRMDFDTDILVRLYWAGVPVLSLDTKVIYPVGGLSHFKLWRDNWLITRMHTRLVFTMLWRLLRTIVRPREARAHRRVAAGR